MLTKIDRKCYGCSMTGVRRAVIYNNEAVVVFHSPQGCGQVIREKDGKTSNHLSTVIRQDTVPIFTTNISDKDIVFGAGKKLEECLAYVIKKITPKYIVVGNSCVAGIIGDDIVSIAEAISKEFKVPIFTVPCFGFMNGGYEEGLIGISQQLLAYYIKPCLKKKREITLIGFVDKTNSYEFSFMEKILGEWAYNINCVFPGVATIAQIGNIASSKACILCGNYNKVNNAYKRVAEIIGEKYEIDIINAIAPIGYKRSISWIKNVGKALMVEDSLIKLTVQKEKTEIFTMLSQYKQYFTGKECIIYIHKIPDFIISLDWFFELLDMTGIRVKKILFRREIKKSDIVKFIENCKMSSYVIEVGKGNKELLKEAAYVFSIRMDDIGKERLIPIPYVNPPFNTLGLEEYLKKIFKVAMKNLHRVGKI